MIFLVNTNQMTDAEDLSEEKGITKAKLMQNAAKGCFDFIRERFENYRNMSFVLMCGAGNNGGDGIELAFLLTEAGIKATVIITDKMPDTEEAKACMKNHKTALKGITLNKHPDRAAAALKKADVIIDCVFGTGFHGGLSKELTELFAFADKCRGVKISVDIPSGVSGNSGSIAEGSFKPDITLVMAAVKTGMLNYPCRDFCGEIKVIHIGISSDCYKEFDGVFTPKDITRLLPKRSESAHKGTFGRVLNVAGSKRYRGAAVLSSRAALRAGAGLVTLASVDDVVNAAASDLPECVFLSLPESKEGGIGADAITLEKKTTKAAAKTISADTKAFSLLEEEAEKANAITIGCGMGNNENTLEIVSFLLKKGNCPVILDADGINCLNNNINVLKDNNRPIIMTPHLGELARLMKTTPATLQANRLNIARIFAIEYHVVLVLKGQNTIIAAPNGKAYINTTGSSALAKAGSGDVLTGIIGSMAAQGLEPFQAAVLGAYLHGKSADLLVESGINPASLLASEVADGLRLIKL